MIGKTKAVIISDDGRHREYEAGDEGYIDGYVQGGDERPYACVIIPKKAKIVLAPLYALSVVIEDGQVRG